MLQDPAKAAVVASCAAVGAYNLLKTTAGLLGSFNRHFLRGTYDMYARYGDAEKKSYSVVTGGSDGIGLELCMQTAAMGFNICIIGRNEEKMLRALKKIKDSYPKVETMHIVFDFNKYFTIDDYDSIIAKALKDIDIAMLFLNAGWAQAGSFAKISQEATEQ